MSDVSDRFPWHVVLTYPIVDKLSELSASAWNPVSSIMRPLLEASDFSVTRFGAIVAAGVYSAFPHNALVLSIFGFLFSLPCFYIAVARPQYISASRFVLLTYNLTCLYWCVLLPVKLGRYRQLIWCWSYNIRQRDIPVHMIALHRALAVTVGVVWAALVSRFWWPAEARRELNKGLGE